jgi:hypothetical protein
MSSFEIGIGRETWEVRGEEKQWVLGKMKKPKKGEPYFEPIAYYSDTAQLFKGLVEKKLRTSDAEGIIGLQMELKKIRDEVMGLYSTTMT